VSSTAALKTITSYDALGRVLAYKQTVDSTDYTFNYSYNQADEIVTMQYPSGRTVSYDYDTLGRTFTAANGNKVWSDLYASNIQYASHGALAHLTMGNGLAEDWTYNSRLQPTSIVVGSQWSLALDYGGTGNNGNLLSQTLSAPLTAGGTATLKQYYQYDGANRLTQVAEYSPSSASPACPDAGSQWCETFSYDIFGNRLISARTNFGASPAEPLGYNAATNRITGTGWQYDNGVAHSRGNITADPTPGYYTYDAESRVVHYSGPGPTTADYVYDGDGQRVKTSSGGTSTVFVYDAGASWRRNTRLRRRRVAGGGTYRWTRWGRRG